MFPRCLLRLIYGPPMRFMILLIRGLRPQPCDKQTVTSEEELLDFCLSACESRSKEKPGFASVCCLRRLAMFQCRYWSAKENRSNLPGSWDITPASRNLLSVSLSPMTITDL